MTIPPTSPQQRAIIDAILAGNNVIVNAVAGSGKTTTILQLGRAIQGSQSIRVLQLTYNSQLKSEVRHKMAHHDLSKVIEVHTYHSLATTYYHSNCFTDDAMARLIRRDDPPRRLFDHRGERIILVIDEAQDLSRRYMSMVFKFLRDMQVKPFSIVIMGDPRQSIYGYKGADVRFLTLADQIWGAISAPSWLRLPLTVTYRLPYDVVRRLNRWLDTGLEYPDGAVVGHAEFSRKKSVIEVIEEVLKLGYQYSDVFVLVPSTRRGIGVYIERTLAVANIPVLYPDDEVTYDGELMAGKVVCSTFHQAKGRERPIVIILPSDITYMLYYNSDSGQACPNPLYVAMTRVQKRLYMLCEECNMDELPFMAKSPERRRELMERVAQQAEQKRLATASKPRTETVTDWLRRVSDTILDDFAAEIERVCVLVRGGDHWPIISRINGAIAGTKEDVSALNGRIIPEYFAHKRRNQPFFGMPASSTQEWGADEFLQHAVHMIALEPASNHRRNQIDDFGWLSDGELEAFAGRLDAIIGPEVSYEAPQQSHFGQLIISWRPDFVDEQGIVEVKCTSHTQLAHRIQTIFYYALRERAASEIARLYNVLTDELFEVTDYEAARDLMRRLVGASGTIMPLSDDEFVAVNQRGR